MISYSINTSDASRKVGNADQYTQGFGDGVPAGLPLLLHKIGVTVVEMIGLFLDAMAAGNKDALHHIYEWVRLVLLVVGCLILTTLLVGLL